MQFLPFIIAAGSLPLISGAPVASNLYSVSADAESTHSLSGRSTNLYAGIFGGDGLLSQGWPAVEKWIANFDDMWDSNSDIMKTSCSSRGYGQDNTEDEMNAIKKAIHKISDESKVDARYIMAIMMQESGGCVRVKSTSNPYVNPGLMQSFQGKSSCNDATGQNPVYPCPDHTIEGMIREGTTGPKGLQWCMNKEGGSDDSTTYYKAARTYNSGSVAPSGNLGDGSGATACYASDIVNRLLGWANGPSKCNSNEIGSMSSSQWDGQGDSGSGSSGSSGSSESSSTSSSIPAASETIAPSTVAPSVPEATQTPTESTPTAAPTTTQAPAPVVPTTTPAPTVVPSSAPAPAPSSSLAPGGNYGKYPYASKSCQQYYTIEANDYCRKIEVQYGLTATDFQSLNPGLDNTCSNLWKGYQYCVKA
ncbi:hypothetical protein PENSTE_c012G06078 [Penicillium steckii]|uniref:LysM domain-containing protein n=1 Tax=Penicillium steckii TaxID=303698 RepID=A0A1V6T672_9EURO|nr:hypothetical protein PENSTE_c012G06078 [Penicillium steckii]